jgi:hypothetical protein
MRRSTSVNKGDVGSGKKGCRGRKRKIGRPENEIEYNPT